MLQYPKKGRKACNNTPKRGAKRVTIHQKGAHSEHAGAIGWRTDILLELIKVWHIFSFVYVSDLSWLMVQAYKRNYLSLNHSFFFSSTFLSVIVTATIFTLCYFLSFLCLPLFLFLSFNFFLSPSQFIIPSPFLLFNFLLLSVLPSVCLSHSILFCFFLNFSPEAAPWSFYTICEGGGSFYSLGTYIKFNRINFF